MWRSYKINQPHVEPESLSLDESVKGGGVRPAGYQNKSMPPKPPHNELVVSAAVILDGREQAMRTADKVHRQDQKMLTGNDDGRVTNFRPDFTQIFLNITDPRRGGYEHVRVSGNMETFMIIPLVCYSRHMSSIKAFHSIPGVFPFHPDFRFSE